MISVVIPAFDEAAQLGRVFGSLRNQAAHEVIVVDGTSRDGTGEVARGFGARVIESRAVSARRR